MCGNSVDGICNGNSLDGYHVNKNESWQLGYQQGREDIINAIKNDLHKLWLKETNKPYTNQGVIEGLYLGIQRCEWYLSDYKENQK